LINVCFLSEKGSDEALIKWLGDVVYVGVHFSNCYHLLLLVRDEKSNQVILE